MFKLRGQSVLRWAKTTVHLKMDIRGVKQAMRARSTCFVSVSISSMNRMYSITRGTARVNGKKIWETLSFVDWLLRKDNSQVSAHFCPSIFFYGWTALLLTWPELAPASLWRKNHQVQGINERKQMSAVRWSSPRTWQWSDVSVEKRN